MSRPIVAAVISALVSLVPTASAASDDVDLSPARWDEATRRAMEARNLQFGGGNDQMASGDHGVVCGTTGTQAVNAGLEALRQGGTAVDAVITTALTQIALALGSWVSYAGIYNFVYYDAESGEVHNLNAGYNTVLGEKEPWTIPSTQPSGRTALVPGFMAGAEASHQRFGKLPWKSLFAPAIHYAQEGIEIGLILDSIIRSKKAVLGRLEETRAIFTREDGTFYTLGDILIQEALARTLEDVATEGADVLYRGAWAEKFVKAVQADGGFMTLEDLHAYEPMWQEPVRTEYHGFDIVAHGLPAQGGVHVIEALNLADAAGLSSMGSYSESPDAFFWLNQISLLCLAVFVPEPQRRDLFGDLDSTLAGRADKDQSDALWERMEAGDFSLTKLPFDSNADDDPKHSDSIVAIDRWGNVAAVVHTINTASWGGTGIFVDGISIPDSASFQQPLIDEVGPGKRLPDPTEPLIALRDNRPAFALASIGSGLHQKTLTTLINVIDFDMDIKEAIDAPSWHFPLIGADGSTTSQITRGAFSPSLIEEVRSMGLELKVLSPVEAGGPRGYVVGAAIGKDGKRHAAGEVFLNGVPRGY